MSAVGLDLYVAPGGNDAQSGLAPTVRGTDGPLATLTAARDRIRTLKAAGGLPEGGVTVWLSAGIYELAAPLQLTAADSGTPTAPITYRAADGATVRLLGGKVVTGWQAVTDPAVLAKLDAAARGQVMQADLTAQGVTDLGAMLPGPRWGASSPGLEVFFADQPMTLRLSRCRSTLRLMRCRALSTVLQSHSSALAMRS
jgi:hypothetical protein